MTSPSASSPLDQYGHNLTRLAQQGVFSPLSGYEAEIGVVFDILLRRGRTRNEYNPVILDLDGHLRWLVVAEVIRRMAGGEAPDLLPTQQVIALNYEALFANISHDPESPPRAAPALAVPEENEREVASDLTEEQAWDALEQFFQKYFPRGLWPPLEEWVAPTMVLQRLQALFLAVRQTEGQVLLFVDHFHRLLGGEMQRYPIQAFSLLKPTLARGEIQLIGACTLTEYRQHIEQHAAISQRLRAVCLPDALEGTSPESAARHHE